MIKKIRAAVIGLGVGAYLARTLSLNPSVELVWLCDINETRLLELGSKLTEAKLTKNLNDVCMIQIQFRVSLLMINFISNKLLWL